MATPSHTEKTTRAASPVPRISPGLKMLRRLIYLYAFFLIFEGGFRKWFLPGLATPLLIVRDPVVVLCIFQALKIGLFRWNGWLTLTALLAVVTAALAMTFGHGNVMITIFGIRSNYLHIPMIFIIGRAFDYQEVCRMGRYILWASIPMTIVLCMQFNSPPDAVINVGVGGIGTSTFDGTMGYRRPSAMFSFVNGSAQFYTLAASFLFLALLQKIGVPWWLLMLSSVAILASIPFSISRLLFFGIAIVAVGTAFSVVIAHRRILWLVRGAIVLGIIIAALFTIPGLETPRKVFMHRWEVAAQDEQAGGGAIWGRTIKGTAMQLSGLFETDIFGSGLGFGTNVASSMLTGDRGYLIAEGEWARCVGELGPIFGFLFIALRAGLAIMLFYRSCITAKLRNNVAALILWFGSAHVLVQGQWGQPTAQGFATLSAGLVLAACNLPKTAPTKKSSQKPMKSLSTAKRRRRVALIPETGTASPAVNS